MLQLAQSNLLRIVAERADQEEEVFFAGIENKLHNLCQQIAEQVDADSAAVFFATEDNPPGSMPYMVMRGASGRLKETFIAREKLWRSWERGTGEERPNLSGFAYRSELTEEFRALEAEERQQAISNWSVTNQIWHLAQGRIANSNRAMDELHGGPGRRGRGDDYAYPGRDLRTTFRTMISVPIFAQGGSVQPIQSQNDEEREEKYPASASPSAEFLSKYRIIGILKVEGKRPSFDEIPDTEVMCGRLDEFFGRQEATQALSLNDDEKQEISGWCEAVCQDAESLEAAFAEEGTRFPDSFGSDRVDSKATLVRKGVADAFSRCCCAEFARQDMELLVLLAMQVGRLMTHRVVKFAADKDIILSENEVGLLNVRWRDINHLAALGHAAQAATWKMKYHLEALREELDFTKQQEVYRAQVSELLDPRGPIREVNARTKECVSLIRKLARTQRHLADDPHTWELAFTDLKGKLDGYDHRSGERFLARGNAQLYLERLEIGRGVVDVKMKLGTEGAPGVNVDEENQLVALRPHHNTQDPDLPLIRRILDPDVYGVDDLAGARVIADYDSDIDEILEELQARAGDWGVELSKVDDLREGKEGGYRAVHVTLHTDIQDLIPAADVQTLRDGLGLSENQPLKIPVEIQLQTAYQHSWATKVHNIVYKREEHVAQELRDEHEILSNVLREADWLSDIVRGGIETMLLPPDFGERRLLEHLQRRIPPADLSIVRFSIACAKEILRDKLRYNGQPEFSFAMEVCECLVRNFGVIDSTVLLLALLYNVWRPERGEVGWLALAKGGRQSERREMDDDLVLQLCERLERSCSSVLKRYRLRLPLSAEQQKDTGWLRIWMQQFPAWFWAIQCSFRDFFLQTPEDVAAQWNVRLQDVYRQLKWRHQEGHWRERLDEWLERAYMLEAAILLANLSDLPDEPGGARRKRLHNDYLTLYREIRKYLPNGATKARVIEALDRAFREVETRLDLPREPEWWGE